MRHVEKLLALAIIGSATTVTISGIFSFTATRFAGSGDSLQLDVELDNMKLGAAVNSKDKPNQPPQKASEPDKPKQSVE